MTATSLDSSRRTRRARTRCSSPPSGAGRPPRATCYYRPRSPRPQGGRDSMKKYQLMAPGPTPVPSEVLLAMAQPMLHHRTPEYEALFLEVRAGLKQLFQTSQDVLPLACSGTGAMEAAVVTTLSAGDTVAVVVAGKFGERWVEICKAFGINVVELKAPFGETVPASMVADALKKQRTVTAVLTPHSESS